MTNVGGVTSLPGLLSHWLAAYECLMRPVWLDPGYVFFLPLPTTTTSIESVEGSLAWHKVCSLEPTELQDMTRLHV